MRNAMDEADQRDRLDVAGGGAGQGGGRHVGVGVGLFVMRRV
ncbi:hypothetical protein SDC9_159483 [bioreactor metagenome]|uniref:Uncharacterized protein n=1 Tax=bioreactor metagenome TaxID=1076179 RepID=A0A645FCV2_9ZZZZ